MTLSEELTWRGFVNQTTFKDITALDEKKLTFYFGVDPSADSMTIGNLAAAMLVRHFIEHGHKAVLLVGGATGMIGDPDGKKQERDLKSLEEVAHNKAGITAQYRTLFAGKDFEIVDNYDWFKGVGYLNFLREVGKHVPMRQMLGREFVQSRLGEDGAGISYAEFSYALIQAYDFLHLHREKDVSLQLCGADQWGNCIAGIELIRRITGDEAHVLSQPLIVNKTTGVKFGKSEQGAVWLDPTKTTPTQFYQFWVNADDEGVEDYIKIYTLLSQGDILQLMAVHNADKAQRYAQIRLAEEVTKLVHGEEQLAIAQAVSDVLTGKIQVKDVEEPVLRAVRGEIPVVTARAGDSILEALVSVGLAQSISEARRLLKGNAVSINGGKIDREMFAAADLLNGHALLRKGKKFKDSALVELA